jgi:hypothetical protein
LPVVGQGITDPAQAGQRVRQIVDHVEGRHQPKRWLGRDLGHVERGELEVGYPIGALSGGHHGTGRDIEPLHLRVWEGPRHE